MTGAQTAKAGSRDGVDPLRPLRAFDRLQQRHAALAVPVAVVKKFSDDEGSSLSGVIAYRAFFSLFPLLLLLTAALGYVLAGDPELREDAVDSVLTQFPVIGDEVRRASLSGSGIALAIGIAGSIWAGFGVVVASERALDRVWAVPRRDRPDFFKSRLRALVMLAALGTLTIVSTVASGLVGGGEPLLGTAGSLVFSFALNLVVFGTVFSLLGVREASLSHLLPGIILAAVCWTLLQLLGGYLVATQVRNATPTYGTFAVVIGLLIWLHVGAVVFVLSAELNVVRARSLWPRSLFGAPRHEDQRVFGALAQAEARDEHQRIDVEFRQEPGERER